MGRRGLLHPHNVYVYIGFFFFMVVVLLAMAINPSSTELTTHVVPAPTHSVYSPFLDVDRATLIKCYHILTTGNKDFTVHFGSTAKPLSCVFFRNARQSPYGSALICPAKDLCHVLFVARMAKDLYSALVMTHGKVKVLMAGW
jgi:hypothetical protein